MSTIYRLIMDERISPFALHVGALLGALSTALAFQTARTRRVRVATYRDYPVRDGTARYDDVWGG